MDGSDGAGAGASFLGCLAPKIKVWALLFSSLLYPLWLSSLVLPLCLSRCVPPLVSHHSLPPLSPTTPNSSNPTRRINLLINNDLIN